jgi:hypothetical protein
LLASLVACSSGGGDVSINVTHDVCTPITISSPTANAAQLAAIDDAFALWRSHGVETLERADQGLIEVRFEPASGLFFGLYDDESSVIYINQTITDQAKLQIVIAHELGHSFGLAHVSGRSSLMNPGNTTVLPTAEDDADVQRLWGPCAP